ncbi:hypothetical protein GCM10025876_21550 [Demequina litorisediminis]|uniref:Cyclic nucleotide-binding domain-containing protein n=1 Tax=Demequina litorisediminis TaxID=1849022 RepID=A0ABQ6IE46_9MICO|nr:hypothetical protein GCM10025876_21550 [Demequina litorisediminis]
MDADSARSLIEQMTRIELARGEVLFNEGDEGQAMFIIVKGKIGSPVPRVMAAKTSWAFWAWET